MPADRSPSVLITGIHSAAGFVISHRFRSEGWFVVGCDQGTTTGRNARVHLTADLTVEEECRRAVAKAADLGNGLDCVVNIAEIRMDGPVDEVGSGAWDVMMDVNAKSMFLLAAAALPHLQEMHGTIVSVAPAPRTDAVGEQAVYEASRAALLALVGSLSTELAPRHVHVHLVESVEDGRELSAKEVADRVWAVAGADEEGHIRSFAHAH
jgi:NAD(P)-dependent dehydrogenase (short-subunit alcohol dehydrogenase family)